MMKKHNDFPTLRNFLKIHGAAMKSDDGNRCLISPHPRLKNKIKREIAKIKETAKGTVFANNIKFNEPSRPGFNDGLIYPGDSFPLGTALSVAKNTRLTKSPLRGVVRVLVVLVDFDDKRMKKSKKHFEDLFFSKNVLSTGSVREYYSEVTNKLIDIQGEVIGPYRLPNALKVYANGESGTGDKYPNARTMAKDAAVLCSPDVDFSKYDNDKDHYVDAFVVVHAGAGAEVNNSVNDIWSHKWVLHGGPYLGDKGTKIYSYLTVPENCRLGVCAHELGHLLFGFPDLYDSDYSSEGVGDWCLMGGGSWNNNGLTPSHPSSWCKCQQGWVKTKTPKSNSKNVAFADVKESKLVYKLWRNGNPGKEYFLVEHRTKTKFDKYMPSSGLLIWHINENISSNETEGRYRVTLIQADGKKHLEKGKNRGDAGDCYPGSSNNMNFDHQSKPKAVSHAGKDTTVAVNNIRKSGSTIKADIKVK